jgi:hypothetical protein
MSREMDKSQIGRAGELAVELYALVTSAGEIDIYSPVVDDDHIDLVAGPRGGEPVLGIQVKTTPGLDRDGLVEARASYEAGKASASRPCGSSAARSSIASRTESPSTAEKCSSSAHHQAGTTRSQHFESIRCSSETRS